jgi:hypothetical protein
MKRLLLLISLICAVPMVAGMSSPANAGNQKAGQPNSSGSASSLPSSIAKKKAVALKQAQPVDPAAPAVPTDPTAPVVPTTPVTPELPPSPGAPTPVDPVPGASTPPSPGSSPTPGNAAAPASLEEAQKLRQQLDGVTRREFDIKCPCYGSISPGMTIFNPSAFGADNNTIFLSSSFQSRQRYGNNSDGELGIGIGLGDARNLVGVELSYSIDSFGRSQAFGSGGFNAKIHKQFSDDFAVAVGWNRFATVNFGPGRLGGNIPFDYPKNSYYAAATKVFSTNDNVDSFLSRIALTVGVGSGQFLSERTLQNALDPRQNPSGNPASGLGLFGSAAFRIAKPLSAVVEWTGQDLSAGLSYVPFEGFPLVISPSFRDITGAGNGARFVLGTGLVYTF